MATCPLRCTFLSQQTLRQPLKLWTIIPHCRPQISAGQTLNPVCVCRRRQVVDYVATSETSETNYLISWSNHKNKRSIAKGKSERCFSVVDVYVSGHVNVVGSPLSLWRYLVYWCHINQFVQIYCINCNPSQRCTLWFFAFNKWRIWHHKSQPCLLAKLFYSYILPGDICPAEVFSKGIYPSL